MSAHPRRTVALLAAALLGAAGGCSAGSEAPPRGATSPAAEEPPAGFTLVATGDLLVHDSVIRQAAADAQGTGRDGYDFAPMLAGVRSLVADADLAICHMETVYGPEEGPFTGYPLFHTPPQLATAVGELGYDSCSTASNHTLDAGPEGVRRTLDAMDAAGLKHAGSARSAEERETPTLLRAGGAKVAHLAYAYGTNGIPVPEEQPWLVNLIDPERIIADARAARSAGADVVVVSMHWGTEWQEDPDELQLSLADRLTSSARDGRRDIDLIIGTHAHVPQAYEKVNGTWVVYGMGDQVAGVMNDPRGQLGSAARFTFAPPRRPGEPWTVRKAEFVPFAVHNDPISVVNLPEALATSPGDPALTDSLERIKAAVLGRGAEADGLRMGG